METFAAHLQIGEDWSRNLRALKVKLGRRGDCVAGEGRWEEGSKGSALTKLSSSGLEENRGFSARI